MISVKIILPNGSFEKLCVTETLKIENLLADLGVNPIEVIVSRNGSLVTELESIREGDEIKITRIVHGG